MNLPALQRIAMEFEKENDIMDQRQEMMDDAIDDVTGLEDEEEGEEVVKEVLDEIGVDLGMAVSSLFFLLAGFVFGCGMVGKRGRRERLCANGLRGGRWARRRPDCRRRLWRTGGLRRLLVAVVVVGTRTTMICRLGWIVYGGDGRFMIATDHDVRTRTEPCGDLGAWGIFSFSGGVSYTIRRPEGDFQQHIQFEPERVLQESEAFVRAIR